MLFNVVQECTIPFEGKKLGEKIFFFLNGLKSVNKEVLLKICKVVKLPRLNFT